jgi:Domain of unknown function (DUF3883)
MASGSGSCDGEIRDLTRRRIEIFSGAGEDWPFAASLKSISEDTAQEYEGRAVLELVQNGHDALGGGPAGRIRIVLEDAGDLPTLYVANDGKPFTSANFHAIVGFGLSDKAAGEGIGNKGLGFRSVLRVSDFPEVYSRDPNDPDDLEFSGYSFRFPTEAETTGLTDDPELGQKLALEVSALDLPVPADVTDPLIQLLGAEGFATVVKLPLRDELALEDVRRQIDGLATEDAPVLLFLDRISHLELRVRSPEGEVTSNVLTRSDLPSDLVGGQDSARDVDLGAQGRYLLARHTVDPSAFREAVLKSTAARQIDRRWLDWDGEAWVGVALRLDKSLDAGTIYTFLPMQEVSPLAAHVHAPFFTKLARREVSLDVPLNEYLMRVIALATLELSRILRTHGEHSVVAPLVVDLAGWKPPEHRFLEWACAQGRTELADEAFLPVADRPEWSTLSDSFAWPRRLKELSTFSANAVSILGQQVLDPRIGADRQARMVKLHQAVLGSEMEPSIETMAEWTELVAKSLKAKRVGWGRWANFYDDLAAVFEGTFASALRGRLIIVDQDLNLQRTIGSEKEDRPSPVPFFAPSVDEEGAEAANIAKLPRALATRIVFTHGDIPWTVVDPVRRRRPGRVFLEANGLVRDYRTDRLLDLLREVMSARPTRRVRIAALQYGCVLHQTLNEAQKAALSEIPFVLPASDGQWKLARTLAFSHPWGTVGGTLLDRLISLATEDTPGLSALGERTIVGPNEWPVTIDSQERWEDYLRTLGVQEGLPLTSCQVESGDGSRLWPESVGAGLALVPSVREGWEEDVRTVWKGGAHPYTRYRFASDVYALPGAGEVERLGSEGREIYAELIGRSLSAWPVEVFETKLWRSERPTDHQDAHYWPTPVTSYLRRSYWLPVEDLDDDENRGGFARPSDAWMTSTGQLPRFVPAVAQSVRTVVGNGVALDRLVELGIRIWEDPRYCGEVLLCLPDLLEKGYIAPHHAVSFKKQCRQAWDHLLRDQGRWPWSDGEDVVVVVTQGMQVASVTLGSEVTVLVPDETDQTKHALFELTAQPVLIADPSRGAALLDLMREHSLEVVPSSEMLFEIYGDDQLIVPDSELPALVADDRQWITTVVALVVELKSGPFVHPTEQSIRQMLERLHAVRVVRVESVRLALGGEELEPPARTTSLPIQDESAPTIVSWGDPGTVFEELEGCASAIAFLIGQPQLSDVFQLVISRLAQVCTPTTTRITDQELASALQVSEDQVKESRAGLRGPLFDLLDRVRVLLWYFSGAEELSSFDQKVADAPDDSAVTAVLDAWSALFPMTVRDLVEACRRHPGFADLRDTLGLEFLRFNQALTSVDPPHVALEHPDRHVRAMANFVEAHQTSILDRIREAYVSDAQERGDLTAYGEARNFEGLAPDPRWLDVVAEPPDDLLIGQVEMWLAEHGATTDLSLKSQLPEIGKLRTDNFQRLDQVVTESELRMRAWCRQHNLDVPIGWSSPMSEARSALESSFLSDFFDLSVEQVLGMVADALGWPNQMPRSLDLTVLGLDPSELISKAEVEADARRRRQHDRTHLQIDGNEMSVDIEQLGDLANAIASNLAEELLNQSGKVGLASVQNRGDVRSGARTGLGLTVARNPGMSDEQRTAVGLVGEVVARAWLERHYGDVEWASGYRNIVLGDDEGSDSLGYDFRVRGQSRNPLYFEVKALVGEARDLAEFEMGETEVVAAQRHGDSYRLLLVCAALDSSSRQILELPNPLSRRGADRYTLLGRGLRYRCIFER